MDAMTRASPSKDPRRTRSEALDHGNDDEMCWICLDETREELVRPCKCPRWVHGKCLARWQLQCSGKSEESRCKFCEQVLPDWRSALFRDVVEDDPSPRRGGSHRRGRAAPRASLGSASGGPASPTTPDAERDERGEGSGEGSNSNDSSQSPTSGAMDAVKGDIIVKFNDMSFRCKVRTGHEGLEDFMQQIREKCGIPEEKMQCLNLTYRCKDPNTGSQMTLEGVNESAFDAAVLCSAAQDRMKQRRRSADLERRATASASAGERSPHKRNRERRRSDRRDGVSAGGDESSRRSSDDGSDSEDTNEARMMRVDHPEGGSGASGASGGSRGRGQLPFVANDSDAARRVSSESLPPRESLSLSRGSLFRRGARRVSAPPPETEQGASFGSGCGAGGAARRFMPRLMRAFRRSSSDRAPAAAGDVGAGEDVTTAGMTAQSRRAREERFGLLGGSAIGGN